VQEAERFAAARTGVPTKEDEERLLGIAQSKAEQAGIVVDLPEVEQAKGLFRADAAEIRKAFPDSPLAKQLETMTDPATGEVSLHSLSVIQSNFRKTLASLKGATSEWAAEQRHKYGTYLDAIDNTVARLAEAHPEVEGWKEAVNNYRAAYLKRHTHEDVQDWLASPQVRKIGPDGQYEMLPQQALKDLQSSRNARLRGFMEKVVDEDTGKNLYETYRDFFKQLADKQFQEAQRLTQLKKTGLPQGMEPMSAPIPLEQRMTPFPPPTAPTLQALPSGGDRSPGTGQLWAQAIARLGIPMAGYAFQPGGVNPYAAAGIGGALAVGVPNFISSLMMKPGGQQFLLWLMKEQGLSLGPESIRLMAAALSHPVTPDIPQ
jgi:hypothetical protein